MVSEHSLLTAMAQSTRMSYQLRSSAKRGAGEDIYMLRTEREMYVYIYVHMYTHNI